MVEKLFISFFKWFPKVFERLKPKSFDLITNSSFKYNTTFFYAFSKEPFSMLNIFEYFETFVLGS
jgi:hypothetical protein